MPLTTVASTSSSRLESAAGSKRKPGLGTILVFARALFRWHPPENAYSTPENFDSGNLAANKVHRLEEWDRLLKCREQS
jgi:hypothetical protein